MDCVKLYICLFLQGRLKPGRMLLVDTKEKVFMKDEVIKSRLANMRPYGKWLAEEVMLEIIRVEKYILMFEFWRPLY